MVQLSRFQDIKHSWNSQVWQYRCKWKTTFNGKQPLMEENLISACYLTSFRKMCLWGTSVKLAASLYSTATFDDVRGRATSSKNQTYSLTKWQSQGHDRTFIWSILMVIIDYQKSFHKDWCINAHALDVNARKHVLSRVHVFTASAHTSMHRSFWNFFW